MSARLAQENARVASSLLRDERNARIVRAMATLTGERGFAGATLAAVCARAKVSACTFYAAFDSRESCFMAAMDMVYERACEIVVRAFDGAESWAAGIRATLADLLLFFEEEPELARVCLVESLAAGPWALEHREAHVAQFTRLAGERWASLAPPQPHPLVDAGVVVSVLAIIQARVLGGAPGPLTDLLGPLVAMATAPYFSHEQVSAEVERAEALARMLPARAARAGGAEVGALPAIIGNPRSHRARRCLTYLAGQPGASNREIARAVGIARDTQVCTLLSRLAAAGLIVKRGGRPGGPNAWELTPHGHMYASHLSSRDSHM